jgi:hypothetical protein
VIVQGYIRYEVWRPHFSRDSRAGKRKLVGCYSDRPHQTARMRCCDKLGHFVTGTECRGLVYGLAFDVRVPFRVLCLPAWGLNPWRTRMAQDLRSRMYVEFS